VRPDSVESLRISFKPGLTICIDMHMNGTKRDEIHPGDTVDVVLKKDQESGKLTRGIVKEILTGSHSHPHGIKVRLTDGKVGRVKAIYPKKPSDERSS
jgi:uncharacterized repeat protein (TIGR03833 family)